MYSACSEKSTIIDAKATDVEFVYVFETPLSPDMYNEEPLSSSGVIYATALPICQELFPAI